MTDLTGWEWMFGRALAEKMLGDRRRQRALRWALRAMIRRTAKDADRAAGAGESARHRGAHAVYSVVALAVAGQEAPQAAPPADPTLLAAWRRGTDEAVAHCRELAVQLTGRPLPI